MLVDFGKLIRQQIPDKQGRVLIRKGWGSPESKGL